MHDDFKKHLENARTYLMMVYPFYAHLIWKMRVIASSEVETAAVSIRDDLFINPKWFCEIGTVAQRGFVLGHEVLHPALGIFWRGANHDPRKSNVAHDFVVNSILRKDKADWVLPGCLFSNEFDGLCYEEVYAKLPNFPSLWSGFGKNEGKGKVKSMGQDVDWSMRGGGGGEAEAREQAARWMPWVVEAAESARAVGRLPAHLERLVCDLVETRVPWQEKLRLAVAEVSERCRMNWSSPSRRSVPLGFFMPREEFIGFDVAVYVDTSGSVSAENLRVAASEIREIIQQSGGRIRWLLGDATIQVDEWVGENDVTNMKGGGGTSFVPVFEHLEENPVKMLVVFTDSWGTMPSSEPIYPVVWAVYDHALPKACVPFGEIVPIPSE